MNEPLKGFQMHFMYSLYTFTMPTGINEAHSNVGTKSRLLCVYLDIEAGNLNTLKET